MGPNPLLFKVKLEVVSSLPTVSHCGGWVNDKIVSQPLLAI